MRKGMAIVGLVGLFGLSGSFTPCVARAQQPGGAQAVKVKRPETPKQQQIRLLLALTGASQLGKQVMTQMIGSMKKIMPQVPDLFWERFMKEVHPEELTDLIIPIYDRHFTDSDIRQLIAFYESPVGRKLVANLPAIMQESMAAGQTWGGQLGARITQELQKEQQ